ncbi:MAG: nucleotide exchange factor GrpE [Pseudomonadota bacterium]
MTQTAENQNSSSETQENNAETTDSPEQTVSAKELRSQDPIELDNMIDSLEEKLDKTMRAYADADNRAKRAEKERSDALRYGAAKMARDLLEVADNLGRAVGSIPEEQKEALKDLISGVELTEKNLLQVFERHDIKRIETENIKFNPAHHEAISQIPSPAHETGDIIDVVRQGYMMGERLLRPAQVIVCA